MSVLLSTEEIHSSRKIIGIGLFLRLCFLVKGVPLTKRRFVRLEGLDKFCCSQEPLSLAAKRRYSVSENHMRSYGCSKSRPEKEVSSGKRFFNWMRKLSGKKEKKVVTRTSSNRSSVSSPRCESCQEEQESLLQYIERDDFKVIS